MKAPTVPSTAMRANLCAPTEFMNALPIISLYHYRVMDPSAAAFRCGALSVVSINPRLAQITRKPTQTRLHVVFPAESWLVPGDAAPPQKQIHQADIPAV